MGNGNNEHEAIGLLKHFMGYYGEYHHHKESMAWVATAFYIAGATYVTHAARGLACSSCPWRVAFSILLILTGILAFAFVWWQFQRRSEGAGNVKDCYKILLQAYNDHPIDKKELEWESEDWQLGKRAHPRETAWLSYIAIVGVTGIALILLNVCGCVT